MVKNLQSLHPNHLGRVDQFYAALLLAGGSRPAQNTPTFSSDVCKLNQFLLLMFNYYSTLL